MTRSTPSATVHTAGQAALNNSRTEVAFELAQMADWLGQKTPGSKHAIHLLGHGSPGAIDLGGVTFTSGNLTGLQSFFPA
jgi:hypothetical protein